MTQIKVQGGLTLTFGGDLGLGRQQVPFKWGMRSTFRSA